MVEVDIKPAQEKLTHGLTLDQIDQATSEARTVTAILSVATFATKANDFMAAFRAYRSHSSPDACLELPVMPDLDASHLGEMLSCAFLRAHAIHKVLEGAMPLRKPSRSDNEALVMSMFRESGAA